MKNELVGRLQGVDFNSIFVTDTLAKKSYSYNDFFARCIELARTFKSQKQRTHTVFVMENSIELLSCYFASIFAGKIATAIDPLKGKDEIANILGSISDSYIVTDKVGMAKLDSIDLLLEPGSFDAVSPVRTEVKESVVDYFTSRDFDNDYLLTFTSGTTGNTKGVRHSLNNLLKSADAFNRYFNMGKEQIFAHFMPMTYMAGILNSIFQPFVACSQIVIMGRFSPMRAFTFWQMIAEYKVNAMWLSPSMLTIILKVGNHKVGQEYCSQVKPLFFIGTAPLHMSTRQEFEATYDVTLFASYGLSETLFLSTETPETLALGGGNVGKLLEGVEYRFGEDGEFLVNVPWMFLGYTNEPTENYFEGSSYKTGDLAKIEENILSIVGRSKDLIIKGGMNISPTLIESVVTEVTGVEECSAFSIMSDMKEELIVLGYSAQTKDVDAIEKEIASKVVSKLGKNYMIDYFYRVSAIPKNINGKNDKKVLKENYLKSKQDNVSKI